MLIAQPLPGQRPAEDSLNGVLIATQQIVNCLLDVRLLWSSVDPELHCPSFLPDEVLIEQPPHPRTCTDPVVFGRRNIDM